MGKHQVLFSKPARNSAQNIYKNYQLWIIKFPFKRNGLPCCEDEPGSEKIALKWKSSIWIFWYDIFLFCMPMKDTQNCIKISWNALILLSIRPRINHFLLINKQCIQMSKGRFSQSQAQMPIHSDKNHSIHRWCVTTLLSLLY